MVALAAVAARAGGVYATHMRSYGADARAAFEEAVRVGRDARLPVVISHFHCHADGNPGLCAEALGWYDESRGEGVEVAVDAYPYKASSTSILPRFVEKSAKVLVAWSKPHPETNGRYLHDIAADWGVDAVDAAERLAPGGAIYFGRDEENVKRADGASCRPDRVRRHSAQPPPPSPAVGNLPARPGPLRPRSRPDGAGGRDPPHDRGVRRPLRPCGTGGRVETGRHADIVVFDPAAIADRGAYMEPERPAAGIDRVLVNGVEVWNARGHTGAAPRPRRRPAHRVRDIASRRGRRAGAGDVPAAEASRPRRRPVRRGNRMAVVTGPRLD